MTVLRIFGAAIAAGALSCSGCSSESATNASATSTAPAAKIPVTIASANGAHVFNVEVARTAAEQERGLMFRTDIAQDGGMIFIPYPADGGPPREATFWMKNTPSALDIVFIRPNGTIARIAEQAEPYSETTIPSGEPVNAVLELRGGRTAALGIQEGDKVSWPGR